MPRTSRALALVALCLVLALATAPRAQAALATLRVANGLAFPDFVTAPPGDPRLFIVERRGDIKILLDGRVLPVAFMDIDSLVMDLSQSPETGMTGLAFHPDFPDSPFVYVDYVDNLNESIVARYKISDSNPNVVDYSSVKIFLQYPHPFLMHYGGHVAFGPDRYLYVGMGDGGHQGDPDGFAQNLNVLWGKILRIDVMHDPPYTIPPDNPFVGVPDAQPEIWQYGLRNPYRFSFDQANGDLWIGDVGQDKFEEIDHTRAPVPAGLNYGWATMEADSCHNPPDDCDTTGLVRPVYWYDHNTGCAVVGGYVYRGHNIAGLQGTYFCADYCYATIWSIGLDGEVTDRKAELASINGGIISIVSGFGVDGFGEMYIVDYGTGATGEVYKIVNSSLVAAEPLPASMLSFLSPVPNPAKGTARFSIRTGRAGDFDLSVLDVAGREVATLASGERGAGSYSFAWNGLDKAGRRVSAGSYLLRASLDGHVTTRSVVYIP
jgi:glucose/arabinose dehydrogenase